MKNITSQMLVDDLVEATMDVLTICQVRFEMQLPFVVELSWSNGTRIVFRAHPQGGLEILSDPAAGALLTFPCQCDVRDIVGVHRSFTMTTDGGPVPAGAESASVH